MAAIVVTIGIVVTAAIPRRVVDAVSIWVCVAPIDVVYRLVVVVVGAGGVVVVVVGVDVVLIVAVVTAPFRLWKKIFSQIF